MCNSGVNGFSISDIQMAMNQQIKKYQFKPGLPQEFEIVNIAKTFRDKKEVMTQPHRAQFYHVLWVEKGEGTHYVDFKPLELSDNLLIFIPKNSVNLFDPKGKYQGKAMIFTDNFFCKNQHDLKYLQSSVLFSDIYDVASVFVGSIDPELTVLYNAMETEFLKAKDNYQNDILHNLLHLFLLQSEREIRKQGFEEMKPSANLDYLLQFKDLLEKNFREEKSVSKYASDLSLSEKQLHKATKTLLEKTPKQIIDERVLLEAKRLLVHSTHSIKEVSYELGYYEPTNFIKYFRKHCQQTPSEFRESYR